MLAFAVSGAVAGLLIQLIRSARGSAPFVPPISLALSLLVLAGVLLGLGIALRRAVTRRSGRQVNPFAAVRLLAAARAGQLAGALLGGFGGGLALQLLTRSVMPSAQTWAPMLFAVFAGLLLVASGLITEALCRVPPRDPEDDPGNPSGEAHRQAEPDAA